MKIGLLAASIAGTLAFAAPASAVVVVLDFKGVATTNNVSQVGGFYNGGTSGDGNTGTNYGVAFSNNALAINNYNGCCEPNDPGTGILYFQSGGAVTINYAAGFTTGFSFVYASNTNAFVTVYDGLNATGNVLAMLSLANNFSGSCQYCVWDPVGVNFAGTAMSIDFGGGADYVAYDDITFGSSRPGVVPEPATWAMMIGGFGLVGAAMRRRTKVTVSYA